jgi:hypothetical protein
VILVKHRALYAHAILLLATVFLITCAGLLQSAAAGSIHPAEVEIVIVGDVEFDASPYVTGDRVMVPYTMSNVVASRIAIYNVTKTFTMSYCTVHGSPSTSGIVLENCAGPVRLHYPFVDSAYQGIYVVNSAVSVMWGAIRDCTRHTVVLISCDEPEIDQLVIKNNALGGVYMYDCYHPDIQNMDAEVPTGAEYFAYIGAGTQNALICGNLVITTIATPFVDLGSGTFLLDNTLTPTRPPPSGPLLAGAAAGEEAAGAGTTMDPPRATICLPNRWNLPMS